VADLTIHPATAAVSIVPGADPATLDFTARLGRTDLLSSDRDLALYDEHGARLGGVDVETPLGTIDQYGTYTAPALPYVDKGGTPRTKVRVRATVKDAGVTKHAWADVTLRLGWPAHWPYLADAAGYLPGGRTWDDDAGRRAAVVLYDLLLQLPEAWFEGVGPVPILRHEVLERPFHFPLPFAFVVLDESYLDRKNPKTEKALAKLKDPKDRADRQRAYRDHIAPSKAGERPTANEQELVLTFLHEFAHVYMTNRCGGADAISRDLLRMSGQVFEDVAIQATTAVVIGGAALGAVWLLPALPFLFWAGVNGFTKHGLNRDFMSDYAGAVGWKTPNYSVLSFPVLGPMIAPFTSEPPNVVTASYLVGNAIGLKHDKVAANPAPAAGSSAADVTTWLTTIGFLSDYSTTDPHEDWAEACMIRAFTATATNALRERSADEREAFLGRRPDSRPVRAVDAGRLSRVNDLYGRKKHKPVVPGAALGDYASWEVDRVSRAVDRRLLGVDGDDLQRFLRATQAWDDGPGKTYEKTAEVLRALEHDEREMTAVAFLRTLERHGDGLRRFAGPDQPVAEGDVLVARDGNPFVVVRVDGEGRAVAVTGLPSELSEKTKAADLRVPLADVRYHWAPSAGKRSFGSHPAYGDLDATLTALTGLWGRAETKDGKRPVDGTGPFFAEALRVAGMEATEFALPKEPSLRDVVAFWHTHGDGPRRWAPGAFEVSVGDWVLFHDENLAGVVTRVADGVPVDVLAGGQPPDPEPGSYRDVVAGDALWAVRMLHDVDTHDVHWVWRAAASARTFGRAR